MDADRFDALSRSFTATGSRRQALIGLLSGTLGLFGTWVEESAAKNCKKIRNKAKRKKCLARARCVPLRRQGVWIGWLRGHVRLLHERPELRQWICCAPVNPAVSCGGRCGTQPDSCGRAVNCGRCPTGGCAGNPCGPGGTCNTTTSGSEDLYLRTGLLLQWVHLHHRLWRRQRSLRFARGLYRHRSLHGYLRLHRGLRLQRGHLPTGVTIA